MTPETCKIMIFFTIENNIYIVALHKERDSICNSCNVFSLRMRERKIRRDFGRVIALRVADGGQAENRTISTVSNR